MFTGQLYHALVPRGKKPVPWSELWGGKGNLIPCCARSPSSFGLVGSEQPLEVAIDLSWGRPYNMTGKYQSGVVLYRDWSSRIRVSCPSIASESSTDAAILAPPDSSLPASLWLIDG